MSTLGDDDIETRGAEGGLEGEQETDVDADDADDTDTADTGDDADTADPGDQDTFDTP